MIDAECSVVVGDQRALVRSIDEPVVPDASREREQALSDADEDEQSEPIAAGRGEASQVADGVCQGPGGRSQTPVAGGLPGQLGQEVAEPAARAAQPAALGVAAEQDLSDGQADQLGVGEARRSAWAL